MRKSITSLLFTFTYLFCFAYELVEVKLPNLLHNQTILDTQEGHDGLMYFITEQNIYQFDGFQFSPILSENLNDINRTTLINNNWLITNNQGDLFEYTNNELNLIDQLGAKASSFFSIENTVYIGTRGNGCFVLEGDSLKPLLGLSDNYIYDIQSDGKYIYLATDDGLNVLYGDELSFINVEQGLPDYIVTRLFISGEKIFCQTYDGSMSLVNAQNNRVELIEHLQSGLVHLQYEGKNNYTYVDIHDNLVIRNNQFTDTVQLSFHVSDLFISLNNTLYLGEKAGGLHKVNLNFDFIKSPFSYIEYTFVDTESQIWMSTDDGIFVSKSIDSNPFMHIPLPKNTPVTSFVESENKQVYFGTLGDGIYTYTLDGEFVAHYSEQDGLINDNVLHLELLNQDIWIATLAGISTLNTLTRSFSTPTSKYLQQANQYFYSVLPISPDKLFIASDGAGLLFHDGEETQSVKLGKNVNQTVLCLEKDENYVWSSIQGEGVYYFNSTDTSLLDESKGLSTKNVSAIHSTGHIAMFGHEKGIDFYDIAERSFSYYTFDDDKKINLQHLNRLQSKILVTYDDGILVIDTSYLNSNIQPLVVLHPLQLFYQASNKTSFKYNENQISFRFGALHALNPENVYFKYRLLGFDDKWQNTQQLNVAYNKLPPGNYIFEVAAGLHQNFIPKHLAHLSFKIKKPFWFQWWFILIASIILASILIGLLRFQVYQVKKKQQAKQEKMQYEFENLRNQVNPHFLFNSFNSLIGVTEEDPEKAIAYIEKLSIFFRNILTVEKYETITLEKELAIAENYFIIQQLRYEDMIHLIIDIPQSYYSYHVVPMVTQLLIENAIKHNHVSKAKNLTVKIYLENEKLCVENNINRKINSNEKSTYLGLKIIRKRYQLLSDQTIDILNEKDRFIVKLPLIVNG